MSGKAVQARMTAEDDRPLVLTAELDATTFAWLDDLRRRHFPAERNHLAAHLTLFHALPGSSHDRVARGLGAVTARWTPVEGIAIRWMPLGRGVAMAMEAPALIALRRALAEDLADLLTRQDAGGFRPHVTIQNKVAPASSRALLTQLARDFSPRPVRIPALRLWRYAGGPWDFVRRFPLMGERGPAASLGHDRRRP